MPHNALPPTLPPTLPPSETRAPSPPPLAAPAPLQHLSSHRARNVALASGHESNSEGDTPSRRGTSGLISRAFHRRNEPRLAVQKQSMSDGMPSTNSALGACVPLRLGSPRAVASRCSPFRFRSVSEEHSRLNCLAREVPCRWALTIGISASCYSSSPPASSLPHRLTPATD